MAILTARLHDRTAWASKCRVDPMTGIQGCSDRFIFSQHAVFQIGGNASHTSQTPPKVRTLSVTESL